MQKVPTYTSWLIRCRESEAAAAVGLRLTEQVQLDRIVDVVVRTWPNGVENRQVVQYRLGDYFTAIRLFPVKDDPLAFRLVFERRPDAGRFWKDLMVGIVQQASTETVAVTAVTLEYKGDDPPEDFDKDPALLSHS